MNDKRGGFWKPGSATSSASILTDDNQKSSETTSLTFNFQSSTPLTLQKQSLPIYKHRSQLLYAIETHPIVIVVGETGSGKSTQLTQYLYENGWADDGYSIVCTQPRRIAAQTLASRVALEVGNGAPLGETVGYTVRFDNVCSPQTAIRYVTDGTLLREATLSDPLLSRYSVIVVDEAHERNLNTDALLGVLKKIRRKRKNLRIVVCSATIDAEAFLNFFVPKTKREKEVLEQPRKRRKRWGKVGDDSIDQSKETKDEGDPLKENGTIISIDGRQHPVDMLYTKEPVSDYVEESVNTALRIHFEMIYEEGDILSFLPTGEDIDRAIALAEENIQSYAATSKRRRKQGDIVFLPLYGTLPYQLQSRVFKPKRASDTARRVIFATNIAETSVTVPHVSTVIDCGFVKMPFFDPKTGFDRLIICPISQASAKQRAGRAGRVQAGKCYRLYSEAQMSKEMEANTLPEVLRTNLSSFLLTLKALGIHNILSFDLMSIPSVSALCHGLETLYSLGAIDDQTNLTSIGNQMAEFPTEPRVSRMLLQSLTVNCSKEMLCIASTFQVRALFHQPRTPKQQIDYDSAMSEIMDSSGDHMTYVNLMQNNDQTPLSEADCKERFVNRLALRRAVEVRAQLTKFLRRYGKIEGMDDGQSEEERSRVIRKCITSGFFSNTAKLANDGRYYSLRGKHMIAISKASALDKYGVSSEYMLFCETYDGAKGGIEARSCSAISGKWLREVAPYYWA